MSMPKVTMVTLPANLLEQNQQVDCKKNKSQPSSLIQRVKDVCARLVSLLYMRKTFLVVLSFLLGRVFVIGEFVPVGLAFFVAVAKSEREKAVLVGVCSVAGVLASGYYWTAGMYVFSMGVYFLWADKLIRQYKILSAPLFMFLVVVCADLFISIIRDFTLYNVLLAFFSGTTCMVLSYVFMYGVPLLLTKKIPFTSPHLMHERLHCLVIVLALAVAGLGNLVVFEYSVRTIIGNVVVMLMACVGGAGLSTAVGVIIGLMIGLSDGNATLAVALYALGGIFAGIVRRLGQLAVTIGFMLGSAITILYFGQVDALIRQIIEGVIAGGLFILIPQSKLNVLQTVVGSQECVSDVDLSRIQKALTKMNNIAEIFHDLSGEFSHTVAEAKEKIHDDELAKTLSAVGEQVCIDCAKRSGCWDVDFYRTYHGILEMLQQTEKDGLDFATMPKVFQENCIRRKELLEKIKFISQQNYTRTFWQKKIVDQRQMVTEQMKATSIIISNLVQEVNKVECADRDIALHIREKSASLGCRLTTVRVTGVEETSMIEAYKNPCSGNRECVKTLLPLVAGIMKEKMTLRAECGHPNKKGKCKLTIQVAKRFHVETGIASAAKQDQQICGDTCAVIQLDAGKVALILSDGMGSGSQAAQQSGVAINFLERLLKAGFDTDVAVKTVNSMLLLRSSEESFVTIDIAVINTYSGRIEFLKIGSAPSFVKRVREVTTVKSASLPIGILQNIEIQPVESIVVAGDFIIMVSDGIIDVPQTKSEKGNWLANYLRQVVTTDPKMLATRILTQARTMSGQQVSDDMTVLVAKIQHCED